MSGATPIDPRERVRDPRISCQTAPPRPARSGHARTRRSVAEPRRSTRRGRHPARRGVCDHPRRAAAALPATRERRGARNVPGSLGTRHRARACTRRARDSDARRVVWSALGVAPGGIGDTCARLTGLVAHGRPPIAGRALCALALLAVPGLISSATLGYSVSFGLSLSAMWLGGPLLARRPLRVVAKRRPASAFWRCHWRALPSPN